MDYIWGGNLILGDWNLGQYISALSINKKTIEFNSIQIKNIII